MSPSTSTKYFILIITRYGVSPGESAFCFSKQENDIHWIIIQEYQTILNDENNNPAKTLIYISTKYQLPFLSQIFGVGHHLVSRYFGTVRTRDMQ